MSPFRSCILSLLVAALSMGCNGNVEIPGGSGCGTHPTSGMTTQTLTVAGTQRQYDLLIPEGVTGDEPLPLVFGFHGRGGTSKDAESFGIQTAAAKAGQQAIFVFPQAIYYAPQKAVGWALFTNDDVDIQFTDAMITTLEKSQCIDSSKIFAAGFSWGADMVINLACFRGNVFRAIHPYSGVGTSAGTKNCTAEMPAIRETIGTADPNYSLAGVGAVISRFASIHHCQSTTHASSPSPDVCQAHDGCDVPVIECQYPGMAHQVPTTGGADAWTFFASF